MKLDRNVTTPKRGKYALIKLRDVKPFNPPLQEFEEVYPPDKPGVALVPIHAIDFGNTEETDFFVIRLKDKFAVAALRAYANAADVYDPEYANEIHKLADQASAMEKRMPD